MNQISVGPTTETDRIQSIDVLRGFVVLGILAMNIRGFSSPWITYLNPASYGDLKGVNFLVWLFTDIFANMKFLNIFSMLYGAGILLLTERLEKRHQCPMKYHYVRSAILLLFGIMHYILIWDGDILHQYSLCAFIVYFFRKLSIRHLFLIGIFVFSIQSILRIYHYFIVSDFPLDVYQQWLDYNWFSTNETIDEILNVFKGNIIGQITYRFQDSLFYFIHHTLSKGIIFQPLAMMLIGMALYKYSVFNANRSTIFYKRLIIFSFIIGMPFVAYSAYLMVSSNFDALIGFFIAFQFNLWGAPFISLIYISFIMLLCKTRNYILIKKGLAYVGRMALTNYILQSIICTWIFFGHGLGLFGTIERSAQVLIVVLVWAIQLLLSYIWLDHFRFGPLEWIWRSLTYWKLQPILK